MSSRLILWDGRLPLPGDDTAPITGGEHGTRITGDRSRQAGVPHLRHRYRRCNSVEEGQPGEAGRSGRRPGTDSNRDGGLRQRALLGSMLAYRRPRGAPHQSSFCEAVRQRLEERCGRRGGDFRSSNASDNALRTGEVDGPAGPAIASSCPRPADLPTNGFDQSYPRPPRLAKLPGVGPIIATAIVGSVNDGRQFRSGREMAAWIGLVPRQYTTGGKPRLGGIGRRANHYLRRQLIHGARAIVSRSAKHDDRQSTWLKALVARRGFNRTIVALANKTARIAWALLSRKEEYAAP